ncbi:quaternary ammonium compound resistance protein [Kozakia baliensis NRIC 0488]|uniref:Multidrug transporter n=1 Tax=Kozakia baliensis TaxID=153496 RepID=A0A1D8USU2_9PROT|nr:SMR family transporter [Kozakia baliensis]AOX16714.1 multidrug transporter [Kozakia baliensis]GBR25759.1 quaternary ammonium compound resistance protein [Kozakia baliensis NRIC 0488]GEL64809.1 multidrug transporter [Kozakia baliensis]
MLHTYLFLGIAIVAEVIATSLLKASDGFTRLLPGALTILFYGIAFYCLSVTLKVLPTGIVYAIWSGIGIVLISVISWVLFKQSLDFPAIFGLSLIIAGVMVVNLFSKSVGH